MTTEDAKKSEHIKLVADPPAENIFDDIEGLRKVATLKVSRKTIVVNVAVKKPPNNVYFRCHPEPKWSLDASVIIGDGGSDDFYFVHPRMLNHHTILPRVRKVTIATTYIWPGGAIGLWPVPNVEETRIACWRSARAAYERSKSEWTQLIWNSDTRDYDVAIAEGINTQPSWPTDRSFNDLLKLGFADKIIDSESHAYVLQLRGLAG
jgi:hypothetical protein